MRRQIRASEGNWAKRLTKAHRQIAKEEAAEAQKFAVGTGPMQAHFAKFISGYANRYTATIGLRGNQANAAFWGAKGRSGWYAAGKYANSATPQFPEWVGNSWDVGELGQGPYAINPTIHHDMEQIIKRFQEAAEAIVKDIDAIIEHGDG